MTKKIKIWVRVIALIVAVMMALVVPFSEVKADGDEIILTKDSFSHIGDDPNYVALLGPGNYKLGADLTDTEYCFTFLSGTSTLDLNGKKIKASIGVLDAGAKVTFKDSKGDGTVEGSIGVLGGEVIFDSGIYKNSGHDVVFVQNASITINGGTFTCENQAYNCIHLDENATAIINGGTFSGGEAALYSTKAGTITINGGTFTADEDADGTAVRISNANSLTINKCVATGSWSGLEVSFTKSVTINGGTFTGEVMEGLYLYDVDAITINGGKFTGGSDGIFSGTNADITLAGGTFSYTGGPIDKEGCCVELTCGSADEAKNKFDNILADGYMYDRDIKPSYVVMDDSYTAFTDFSVKTFSVIKASYTVAFDTDGGDAIKSQTVQHGSKATKPANPTKPGYTFAGWYADSGFSKTFDFGTKITEDTTVFAKWTKNATEDAEQKEEESGDVTPEDDSDNNNYSNEWVKGLWYSADGSQTYKPIGSWRRNSVGWWYEDEAGWYPKDMWQKIDGKWYFFDEAGYMLTDQYAGNWDAYSEGSWWVGSDGAWDGSEPGVWRLSGEKWYFTDSTGWFAANRWLRIRYKWYWFDADGYWVEDAE